MALALGLGTINGASNEPRSSTPQDVFDGMRKSFRADKAKGVNVRYQFELSGPSGVGLPPNYSLFGKVVAGLDVVSAIEAEGSPSGAPKAKVVIESVTINES